MAFEVVDPASGEVLETYQGHGAAEVERRVEAAFHAQVAWREDSLAERAQVLRRMAAILRGRKDQWAARMAREMGKPVAQGTAEAEKCAWVCEYYADNAEAFLANEHVSTDASKSYVRYDPLGTVLAVMPWNYPFWQVYRFAAPALMAGNTMVLKHASNTPGCGLDIEAIAREAGAPDGALTAVLVGSHAVEGLIADRRIAAVTLTGSEGAGMSVGASAGRHLKKAVLELGGSDAFVVLADADLDRAAEVAAQARLLNAGQSCISAKRFIVVREVAEAFAAKFRDHLAAARVGDPADVTTEVGPVAREDLREELQRQVDESVRKGARCVLGGQIPEGRGFFYPPTLLTDVGPGMPAWDEEVFGPIAALRVVADESGAISAANDSPYGLGASIWTGDVRRGEDLASFVEAGSVFVNGLVKSDPRLPFGGVKRSGYGRELSWLGVHEFVNAKTVWIG